MSTLVATAAPASTRSPAQPSRSRSRRAAIAMSCLLGGALGTPTAHAAQGEGRSEPSTAETRRFLTSRHSDVELPLPGETDAFFFLVFGDRTGGTEAGIAVLEQAVVDANLLAPDLVMTVGDLIQGYNTHEPWLRQMRQYREVMGRLRMPWFPVAGNHDVYWRGAGKPPGEHEANYETHFGPLWYAFRHKDCWFVALYSDEGDPVTGERDFKKPNCQRMSPEQFAWLDTTLHATRDAAHVFVFLHHPRWLSQYGDDWAKVHARLAAAGNVSAVFAGHIHEMRYDGVRDGIEYFACATIGGHQWGKVPEAGFLHQFHVVTVRPDRIAVSALPVGEVIDARAITGEVSVDARTFDDRFRPTIESTLRLDANMGTEAQLGVAVDNPIERPIEVTLIPHSADSRWTFTPDHRHAKLMAGQRLTFEFRAHREPEGVDSALDAPFVRVVPEYLGQRLRFPLPERDLEVPLVLPDEAMPAAPAVEHALFLDGTNDHLLASAPRGVRFNRPFTLEFWFVPSDATGRRVLATSTAQRGVRVEVDGSTLSAVWFARGSPEVVTRTAEGAVAVGRAAHVRAQWDGERAELFLDGQPVAAADWRPSGGALVLPLAIGAALVDGIASAAFAGQIDEVHVSVGPRGVAGTAFEVPRRAVADDRSRLLLHFDAAVGAWAYDSSGFGNHARRVGGARVAESDR